MKLMSQICSYIFAIYTSLSVIFKVHFTMMTNKRCSSSISKQTKQFCWSNFCTVINHFDLTHFALITVGQQDISSWITKVYLDLKCSLNYLVIFSGVQLCSTQTQYTMGTLLKQPTHSFLKIQICLMVSKIYSI